MKSFQALYDLSAKRKGGSKALESLLSKPASASKLKAISDDRYLAQISKSVFQAGFVWKVVESKWDGFEKVFWQFEPRKLRLLSDEQLEKISQDKQIIRNFQKVITVRHNASMIYDISQQYDSFGKFITQWDKDDIVGLWLYFKKHGARLGGMTCQYFLRFLGYDTFILSRDVCSHLCAQKIVSKFPTSKRDLVLVQDYFNKLKQESGRTYTELSQIMAYSCGENRV